MTNNHTKRPNIIRPFIPVFLINHKVTLFTIICVRKPVSGINKVTLCTRVTQFCLSAIPVKSLNLP